MSTLVETPRQLTANDRCDGCGAAAYVKVRKDKDELLFCAHDFTKHEFPLVASGWTLDIDDRARLKD